MAVLVGGDTGDAETSQQADRLRRRKQGEADVSQVTSKQIKTADLAAAAESLTETRQAVWSSGVAFYPPSRKYWRIGGKWYDFSKYLSKHPGGSHVLELARDRFEDCTFVFESHHHNYRRARAVIKNYEVSDEVVQADGIFMRPQRGTQAAAHYDAALDSGKTVKLISEDSFYSVMRDRVAAHLRSVGCPAGGPTRACIILFWVIFASWLLSWLLLLYTGSFLVVPLLGIASALLGAFGHNWVHQPKYKFWAYLSLDTIGFSSNGWFREHNLQHHMYTNTPWDNHFKGTDPFLVTDPTVERQFVQRFITPYLNPIILCFGVWGNYTFHLGETIKGNEVVSPWKLVLPLQVAITISTCGLIRGVLLILATYSIMSIWYFSLALMNHNAEHCHDVRARNAACDWGEAQLVSSADWGVQMPFHRAWIYLWLNYHTVHHLFPRIDFSHHHAIQSILMKTCDEFGVKYNAGRAADIYKEMIHSFSTPLSLMQEIIVNAGGL